SAVVAGIGATRFAVRSRASEAALAVRAIAAALSDAGLGPADVDGVVRFDREAVWEYDLAFALGITSIGFYNAVPFGAGAAPALLRLAALAIGEGLASVVLGWHARSRRATLPPLVGAEQFQVPFGLDGTAAVCALLFRRPAQGPRGRGHHAAPPGRAQPARAPAPPPPRPCGLSPKPARRRAAATRRRGRRGGGCVCLRRHLARPRPRSPPAAGRGARHDAGGTPVRRS